MDTGKLNLSDNKSAFVQQRIVTPPINASTSSEDDKNESDVDTGTLNPSDNYYYFSFVKEVFPEVTED